IGFRAGRRKSGAFLSPAAEDRPHGDVARQIVTGIEEEQGARPSGEDDAVGPRRGRKAEPGDRADEGAAAPAKELIRWRSIPFNLMPSPSLCVRSRRRA